MKFLLPDSWKIISLPGKGKAGVSVKVMVGDGAEVGVSVEVTVGDGVEVGVSLAVGIGCAEVQPVMIRPMRKMMAL